MLTLTEVDLAELNRMLRDFRHADAMAMVEFLNGKVRAQQMAQAENASPPNGVHQNGEGKDKPSQ